MQKKVRKRHYFILIIHLILAILMLTIHLNQWVNPKMMEYFQYVAMGFPVLFIGYCILILYWFWVQPRWTIPFLILLPIYLPNLFLWINYSEKETSNYELKVLSYNVLYGKKDIDGIEHIETYIKNQKPDIVFLQEIWSRQWKKQDNLLTNYNNAVFPFVGISTIHTIIDKKEINLYNTNGHACWADIVIKEDTLRAFSIYLEPNYLTKDLFKFSSKEEFDANTDEILRRLEMGFKTHEEQLKFIKEEIKMSPYPVIVCGDLNAVPNSFEYYQLTSFLNDAFKIKGNGLGTSFHDYFYPLKIDYTFFDDNFEILYSYTDNKVNLSDHFPVISTFRIKQDYEKTPK